MNDPFRNAEAPPLRLPFATDEPMQFAETAVASSLPTRPRTEELDLDIGNFLNGDEEK